MKKEAVVGFVLVVLFLMSVFPLTTLSGAADSHSSSGVSESQFSVARRRNTLGLVADPTNRDAIAPHRATSLPRAFDAAAFVGPYCELLGITFTQNFSSMSYNVTAVQQAFAASGPAYFLCGLAGNDPGYLYEVGLSWNWLGPYAGFDASYVVFFPNGSQAYPPEGGFVLIPLSVNQGDSVQLSLSFSGGNVNMNVYDWNTSATSLQTYSSFGATYFVGLPNYPLNPAYSFTGLMTEQLYTNPYYDNMQGVVYSDMTSAKSSAWMWIQEIDSAGNFLINDNTPGPVSFVSNPLQFHVFSSNGATEYSNAYQFVTGASNVTLRAVDSWPTFQHDSAHTGYTDMEVLPHSAVKSIFNAGERLLYLVAAEGSAFIFSDSNLYAINASDGNLKWTYGSGGWSPPAIVNGIVYVGGWAHNFVALDARDGSVIWEYPTGGGNMGAPVVAENIVYFSSDDGYAYALTADKGILLWKYQTGVTRNSPTVANGIVYLTGWNSSTTALYAINALNGNPIWNYASTPGSTLTSASVSDGIVYSQNSSNLLAINAFTGKVIWVSQVPGIGAAPAIDKGKVYVSSSNKVYAFNASNGAPQWTFQTQSGSFVSDIAVSGDIIYFGERFYYIPNPAKLYAVNATDGSPLWTFDSAGASIYGLAIADNAVYFSTESGVVYAFGGVHDVAVTNVASSKTVVCQGFSATVNVIVANQGDFTETFNVTAYANTTAIQTETLSLTSEDATTLTFTWNIATGFVKSNYTLSATAWPVPGETNTTNNNFTGGWIKVTIVGDVNGDGKVNLIDVFSVALAFGSYPGHPMWNPNYDINNDYKINIIDYLKTALNYGKVDP